MDVWLGTLRLVYTRYSGSGEDYDGYVLRDGCFSIVWEEASIGIAEGIIVGVGIIDAEGCGVWVQSRCCNGCRGPRGGQIVGYDCKDKQGYVVFLGQTDGGRGGGEGGAEGALEGCEWYAEVYSVVVDGGLDGVGFED